MGFSQDGGRGQSVYLCLTADLTDVLLDLLGYTEQESTDGRLIRHLPRAHPRYPWLFVDRIAQVQGVGNPDRVAASSTLEASPVEYGTSYPNYKVTVEWAPRPYAVIGDDKIEIASVDWTDTDGSAESNTYAAEWLRYTDWEYLPRVELITAQQGQMVLRRGDASEPNGNTFPGMPQLRLASSTIIARWFHVPYRYVTSSNSYLVRFQGRINQSTWNDHAAGSLLFDSFRVKRYTPPFPDANNVVGAAVFADKLCDIELVFQKVYRTTPSAPTPSNTNWIAAGHNLMPWFTDRQFYYATSFDKNNTADATKWYPPYLSAPFQLLFTDPDS